MQLTELETEFNNLGNGKAIPSRYLRSQKPKVSCRIENNIGEDDDGTKILVLL